MKNIPHFFCFFISLGLFTTSNLAQEVASHPGTFRNIPSDVSYSEQQLGKLIFAIDLIRHGDRTPIDEIPTVSYVWPEGVGQLTQEGMVQEFLLGKQFRERYITQSHLLPERYTAGSLYARSTDADRTIMSANLVLTALYDKSGPQELEGYQPIPVRNRPRPQEDLLLPDNNLVFNFDALLHNAVFSSEEWVKKEQSLNAHFPQWSQALGRPITSLYDLKALGDTLFIDQLHHVPNPPFLSDTDVNTIIEAGVWSWCTIFKNKIIAQASGANLLAEIVKNLEAATQPNQPLKYILYAAHDSTILAQLSILGYPLSVMPPYASDLNIELFEQENDHYFVQVKFNGQLVILACSGSSICTLAQLEALSKEASAQLKGLQ